MEHKHDDECNCKQCSGHCMCGCYGFGTILRVIFGIIIFVAAIALVARAAFVVYGVAAGTLPAVSILWVFLGFVALGVFAWIVSWFLHWPWHGHYQHWDMGGERATRILRRRYARGEISEAQFKRMMKTLDDSRK